MGAVAEALDEVGTVEPRRAVSARRLAANRANAARSTGPRTEEGKARARANAVKHGLTGAGIALPDEDRAAVDARFVELQAELQPGDVLGMVYVEQAALMSVRVRRAAEHEAAMIATAGRHAAAEFDRARLDEVDRLFDAITAHPGPHRRRLLASAEGIDRLAAGLSSVREQVEGGRARDWGEAEWTLIEAFCGRRMTAFPVAPTVALLAALAGDLGLCGPRHPVHAVEPIILDLWLAAELTRHLDAELALLAEARAALDPAVLRADRAEAARRARFDAGPGATAARKYEAAARREFHRALRDLRAHEAALAPEPPPAAAPEPQPEVQNEPTASEPEVQNEPSFPIPAEQILWPRIDADGAQIVAGQLRE